MSKDCLDVVTPFPGRTRCRPSQPPKRKVFIPIYPNALPTVPKLSRSSRTAPLVVNNLEASQRALPCSQTRFGVPEPRRRGFESHPLRHFLYFVVFRMLGVYHGVCFALVSGRLSAEKRLADMSRRGNAYGSENRVNILKKGKVGKNWNLYPAVVEPNGKLRDRGRVRGKV